MLHRLQSAIAADNLARAEASLSLSVGFAQFNPRKPSSIADLLRKADMAMYEDKLAKTDSTRAQGESCIAWLERWPIH